MSAERAKALGIKPLARYVSFATAGYKPEEMGWAQCSQSRKL